MEKVWIFMILFSFVVSIYSGNMESVIKVLFDSTGKAIELSVGIAGILCMWSGFMKIAEKSGFVKLISFALRPIIKRLFPEAIDDDVICGHIGMNMAANILGLGNVATPIGMRVMEDLQQRNEKKDTLSNSMLMFLVMNMASIQLVPTTVIAMRANYGSNNPTSIVFPTIISSVTSVIVGIIIVKLICKKEQ